MSKEINNSTRILEINRQYPHGRLLALDLGTERVGVAVSDELQITIRPLKALRRTNWKQLLLEVRQILEDFDAQAMVIGLPLRMDGSVGVAAMEARRLSVNFAKSLTTPIFLQDERLTSHAAEITLRDKGCTKVEVREQLDSAAAVLILRDFIAQHGRK